MPAPGQAKLALSADHSRIWATTGPTLKSFDVQTGETLAERPVGQDLGDGWQIAGLAPTSEAAHEGEVWVLHRNGYQLRWDEDLGSFTDWAAPPPGIAWPCDMARTADGVTYVINIDITVPAPPPPPGHITFSGWSYYLQRRAANGQWTQVDVVTDVGNAECPRLAIDEPLGRVAVLVPYTDRVRVYSSNLGFISETDFSGLGRHAFDIATVNSVFAMAMTDGTQATLAVVDPDGAVMDEVPMDLARAVDMQVEEDNLFHVWWTGLDVLSEYGAGRVRLDKQ